MHPTKCRCGENQVNFKHNIGAFYIDECCTKAGYDGAGNLVKEEPPAPTPPTPVETRSERKAREKAEREAAKVLSAPEAEQDADSQDA